MSAPIYLDHNATTPLDPRVLQAMQAATVGTMANASSLHRFGRAARDAVERARAQIGQWLSVPASQVLFTSGGTESNNLAIRGVAAMHREPAALLYGATEHSAVLEPMAAMAAAGWGVEAVPADARGQLDPDWLSQRLQAGDVRLLSAMRANNETGVIQDVAPLFRLARAAGVICHCDAVQAAGKIPLSAAALEADLITVSAHKIGGPCGVGALVMASEVDLIPQIVGGGQESGWRGGTENVAGIVGFGAAAELASRELEQRSDEMSALRQRCEMGLQSLPGVQVFALDAERLPNTLQFSMAGFDGEALLMALDRAGIAVSSGSACDSGKGEPSHVLLAMGLDAQMAKGAVRVSFGRGNTAEDVDRLMIELSKLNPANSALMRSVSVGG